MFLKLQPQASPLKRLSMVTVGLLVSTVAVLIPVTANAVGSTPTTTTVSVFDQEINLGDAIAMTGTVSRATPLVGDPDPTGDVTFDFCYSPTAMPTSCDSADGTITSPVSLEDNAEDGSSFEFIATWQPANAGYYLVEANYLGDTEYAVSSGTAEVRVIGLATTTTLALSDSSIDEGDAISMTGAVNRSVAGTPPDPDPTGDVVFDYCYSDTSMPASNCTPEDGTVTSPGSLDDNTDDGSSFEFITSWEPADAGYYRVFAFYEGDEIYDASDSAGQELTVRGATSLIYSGTTYYSPSPSIISPANVVLSATLSGFCLGMNLDNEAVYFYWDDDGDGLYDVPLDADTSDGDPDPALTNGSGTASFTWPVSSGGVYEILAVFEGNADCVGTTATGVVVVAGAGDSSNGGGHYTVPGTGKVNLGYVVQVLTDRKTGVKTTKGQLVWNTKAYRIKGTVSAYSQTNCVSAVPYNSQNRCAGLAGAGTLFEWMEGEGEGEGYWSSIGPISYTLSVADGGSTTSKRGGTKVNPDWVRMSISGSSPVSGSTTWYDLRGGNLIVK